MLAWNRIPYWSHRRRLALLRRFRRDLQRYRSDLEFYAFPFRSMEGEEAREIRTALEPLLPRVRRVIETTGQVHIRRIAPGGQVGAVKEVNVVTEAFHLDEYHLTLDDLVRVLDEAIAVYQRGSARALLRTLNPLFWVEVLLSAVEVIPFLPLALVGVNPARAAHSRAGMWVRHLVRLAFLGGILLLLYHTLRG
ncbi:MAG: hypothetical protein ACE5GJ_00345 [Gemmatimonadota bacterium]